MAQRLTAADFDPEVLMLFDAYVHGALDRRGFLDKAKKYAVGGMSAAMLLDALSPKFAEAQQVKKDDARLETSFVEFPSPQGSGTARGYLVRPANSAGKKLPAILVVHENRGLNPHIEDIARRIAPRRLHGVRAGRAVPGRRLPRRRGQGARRCSRRSISRRRARTSSPRPAGCGPGPTPPARSARSASATAARIVNMLATRVPELAAGVPFYGGAAPLADVPKIKAALLLQFAETDERVNAAWPPYEAALKEAKVPYEAHIYPGTQHGFNNDTTPRYDEKNAKLAWERTMAHFAKHVKG